MKQGFTKEERKKFMFRNHVKNHLFEYVLDFIGPIILTIIVLYLCKAEEIGYGIFLAVAYSAGKLFYKLRWYKKDYIDIIK